MLQVIEMCCFFPIFQYLSNHNTIAGWKVLVMDKVATRVISSALTMYDIMEKRVTLVEQLAINRQPFPEMDVIYLMAPTIESARKVSGDFESRAKAKYGNVHLFFLDTVRVIFRNILLSNDVITIRRFLRMSLPSSSRMLCW